MLALLTLLGVYLMNKLVGGQSPTASGPVNNLMVNESKKIAADEKP